MIESLWDSFTLPPMSESAIEQIRESLDAIYRCVNRAAGIWKACPGQRCCFAHSRELRYLARGETGGRPNYEQP
jgi:hypothetical protein